jgi:hypothetical protein
MHVQAGLLLQSQHLMCPASRDAMMTSGKSVAQNTDLLIYYGTGCLSSTVYHGPYQSGLLCRL